MSDAARAAARERGRRAEDEALRFFEAQGFALLWRNLRLGKDELDLVLRQGDLLLVVEVRHRARAAAVGPLESVGPRKQALLLRATAALLRGPASTVRELHRCRIDVVAVQWDAQGHAQLQHVPAAVVAQPRMG